MNSAKKQASGKETSINVGDSGMWVQFLGSEGPLE